MRKLRDHGAESAIPAPVWHELRFGCARLPPTRRRDALERYLEDVVLASLQVLDYDQEAAGWHAWQRARLVTAGQTPPFVDGQITVIAHVNDLIVATSNNRDFEDFHGVRMERWAVSEVVVTEAKRSAGEIGHDTEGARFAPPSAGRWTDSPVGALVGPTGGTFSHVRPERVRRLLNFL